MNHTEGLDKVCVARTKKETSKEKTRRMEEEFFGGVVIYRLSAPGSLTMTPAYITLYIIHMPLA